MFQRSYCAQGLFAKFVTVLLAWAVSVGSAAAGDPPTTLRVGISKSLYRHVPETLFKSTFAPVESLIQEETGMAGQLFLGGASEQLLERLVNGQVELAVFSGMEFAWARQKNSKLQPLVIAVNQQKYLRVHVLVRQDCAATCFADLKDLPVALPRGLPHCELFFKRQGNLCGSESAAAFSQLCRPGVAEDALDDVVEGKVQAAVIDGAVLECYQRRKPGRFAQLKELRKPESFPVPIVAYVEGKLGDADLRAFREGIVKAQKTAKGRQALMLWKLTGFEPVPDDYGQLLDNVAKTYAPPASQQ
jgi:ABC-type phosphate/phosphonate transport system substrate-binding protein